MKKTISILLLVAVIMISGCTSENSDKYCEDVAIQFMNNLKNEDVESMRQMIMSPMSYSRIDYTVDAITLFDFSLTKETSLEKTKHNISIGMLFDEPSEEFEAEKEKFIQDLKTNYPNIEYNVLMDEGGFYKVESQDAVLNVYSVTFETSYADYNGANRNNPVTISLQQTAPNSTEYKIVKIHGFPNDPVLSEGSHGTIVGYSFG